MSNRQRLTHYLEQIWYGKRPLERSLLWPLSVLFSVIARRRRKKLTALQKNLTVPVIIVGNIAVGGTGKTPLIIRLTQLLQEAGYRPGIVSRGYGADKVNTFAHLVTHDDKPEDVGDEALLLLQRTGVPLVIGAKRVLAVEYLLVHHEVDVVLSDDGLQHYALPRGLEIAVVDGTRRFGNGYCLPAGPLREPVERLSECDFVVCNGTAEAGEYAMQMTGSRLVPVLGEQMDMSLPQLRGEPVRVVTAIGNPQRFLKVLEAAGLRCTLHAFPDHHLFEEDELYFPDQLPVLMTEKDAVKCRDFDAARIKNCWYLPVDAQLDNEFEQAFLQKAGELITHG